MNILKLTDKPPELEAVKDKVLEELQYLRSLDTAGDGGRSHFLTEIHTHESNLSGVIRKVWLNKCTLPIPLDVFVSLSFRHQCDQEPD